MTAVLRPPGVLIERFTDAEPPEPTRVDVPVFVTVAERGPVHTPTRITSWPQFVATFGSFVRAGFGAYAAKAFFDNGGRACWVVRAAAAPTVTATSTAVPQPADRLSSIVLDPGRLKAGAAATLTQGLLRRTHLVTVVDVASGEVTWDRPLSPGFDLTLSIDVATGAGTASAVVAGAGGDAFVIEAASPGAFGNQITATIGSGRPAATANRLDEPCDQSFAVVRSTVGFDAGTSVTVSQDLGGVVTTADRVVAAVDRAAGVLRWDAALPGTIDVAQPLSVRSHPFTLTVSERGEVRQVFLDLQAAPGGPRHVADVVNASGLVRVVPLSPRVPSAQSVRLGGGRDGIAALTVDDFVGDDIAAIGAASGASGLATTVDLDEPAAVAIPDLVLPPVAAAVLDVPSVDTDPCWPCQAPPQPPPPDDVEIDEAWPGLAPTEILRAQQLIIEHCERNGERMALLDPPGGEALLGVDTLAGHAFQLPSTRAALIAPWISVVDPAVGAGRGPSRVPPSAHYAGLIARTDLDRGPWAAPANQPLQWAHGLGARYDDDRHALLNEAGIVVLQAPAGQGVMPMGVRTLSPDPLWLFITVRRTMIWLRRLMRQALAWAAFEPVDAALVAHVTTLLDGLLSDVWADGGLAGAEPREAFFVHALAPEENEPGELLCTVGVALARPAEFITVQVRRADNRLELREQPERRSWP